VTIRGRVMHAPHFAFGVPRLRKNVPRATRAAANLRREAGCRVALDRTPALAHSSAGRLQARTVAKPQVILRGLASCSRARSLGLAVLSLRAREVVGAIRRAAWLSPKDYPCELSLGGLGALGASGSMPEKTIAAPNTGTNQMSLV
jgi:hypothetical protein